MGNICNTINIEKSNTLEIDGEMPTFKSCTNFIPPVSEGYVVKVYDGDTITIATRLPIENDDTIYKFSVRLRKIDSPELRTKNIEEKEMAIISRDALSEIILHKFVTLENVDLEKYGRVLADVIHNGVSMSEWMLKNKLAVPYDGGRKVDSTFNWKEYMNRQ